MKTVVIGGGIAGLRIAKALGATLITESKYFVFVPRLPDMLFAHKESFVSKPVHERHSDVIIGRVTNIDTKNKHVLVNKKKVPYDELIIATGARSMTSVKGAKEFSVPFYHLKDVHYLQSLKDVKQIVIVGAGPTGVEVACELAVHTDAYITLLQRDSVVLPTFSERSQRYATRELAKLGVEVVLNCNVTEVKKNAIVGTKNVKFDVCIWAAGVQANIPQGVPAGRGILVDEYNRVIDCDGVWAAGDCAQSGTPLVAQAAIYEADLVIKNIQATRKGGKLKATQYKHKGNFLSLGHDAIVDGAVFLTGHPAKLVRRLYYDYQFSLY